MKNIKNLLSVLMALIALTTIHSCKEDAPVYVPAEKQVGGTQAFIYENTPSNLSVTPDKQTFELTFGRQNESQAATVDLQVIDKDDKFDVPVLSFAAGEKTKKLNVAFNIAITKSSQLTIIIPKEQSYLYGNDSITITVTNDYTWLDAGMVSFNSDWAGATKDIKIERAKEGNGLYRILSPYNVLEPAYCPKPGYHLQFTLDANYNAVAFSPTTQNIGETSSTGGWWWLYCNPAQGNTFTNVGNVYTIDGYWASSDTAGKLSLKSYATEIFTWTKDYPGAL